MRLLYFTTCIIIITVCTLYGQAQPPLVNPPATQLDSSETRFRNAWGVDILISTGGFGLGGFYRYEFTRDFSGFVALSVSESKDEREIESYNYYTQSYYSPGKTNRFLVIPLMMGVERRLFSNQIMDNFRPYLSAGFGPTLIYATPYRDEFFESLGKGHPHYTVGGYLGAGAYFGIDRSTLFGINMRYYLVPFRGGIESLEAGPPKKEFGGFFIALNLGSAW